MLMLMSSGVLLLMNGVTATGRSDRRGYSFRLRGEKKIADNCVSTSAKIHLGANPFNKPSRMSYERVYPSSQVTRKQEIGDDQYLQDPNVGACDFSQVIATQDSFYHLPDGTPIFHVTITNNCVTCSIEDIHIACGDWASSTLVNPAIFRKLGYNDCIVNNGSPLAPQNLLFFEYSNTFSYPMLVDAGRACCCH
ncbi:unnamed protein product [Calypogeia fissa]